MMKQKKIPLKVNSQYTLYTYSDVTNTAHKVELTVLNVFLEIVSIPDSPEGRVAIGTARVRGVDKPVSLQVKLDEDVIVKGWDQLGIEDIEGGICFLGSFESNYNLLLGNMNPNVEDYSHCYYRDHQMESGELIFPVHSNKVDEGEVELDAPPVSLSDFGKVLENVEATPTESGAVELSLPKDVQEQLEDSDGD